MKKILPDAEVAKYLSHIIDRELIAVSDRKLHRLLIRMTLKLRKHAVRLESQSKNDGAGQRPSPLHLT